MELIKIIANISWRALTPLKPPTKPIYKRGYGAGGGGP